MPRAQIELWRELSAKQVRALRSRLLHASSELLLRGKAHRILADFSKDLSGVDFTSPRERHEDPTRLKLSDGMLDL